MVKNVSYITDYAISICYFDYIEMF